MTLPEPVRRSVEARLGAVRSASPVSGGCINHATRVELASGPVFLKHNADAPAGLFAAEAEGLDALRRAAAGGLRIPEVLAHEEGDAAAPAWIALEWLEPGPRGPGFHERLGHGLALLHRARGEAWGWPADNYIGPLPQPNESAGGWAAFWRDRRLAPQLDLARRSSRLPGGEKEWERLFARLPELLAPAEEDGPSLLHGDLWGGNVLSAEGDPAVVDPAAYHGHREVDLAMSELFGGFDARFHAAYAEAWPLQPGYRERRRAVYQLFYLLVHVNLFGGGYLSQTAATLRATLAS